jgi:hypothetical protein
MAKREKVSWKVQTSTGPGAQTMDLSPEYPTRYEAEEALRKLKGSNPHAVLIKCMG